MPYQVFVTVTGAKQGAFKSGSTQKGREGKIPVLSVSYGVAVPRDATTGQATGKRVQKPVTIAFEWDPSSTQFLSAAYTNETLTSVVIEYYGQSHDGSDKADHTVKLKNATISEITDSYAAMTNGAVDGRDIQTVAINFQSIEVSTANGSSATDELRPYL